MTVRFGTDGVRGLAGRDLTPEIATAIGRAAAGREGLAGYRSQRTQPQSGDVRRTRIAVVGKLLRRRRRLRGPGSRCHGRE
ncbi:MAG TPA: hypothetical protein PKB00_14080, partial [Microthrixaceae bacterium]|nr:hypothetical protein [Microthrixaceae bacterium]